MQRVHKRSISVKASLYLYCLFCSMLSIETVYSDVLEWEIDTYYGKKKVMAGYEEI